MFIGETLLKLDHAHLQAFLFLQLLVGGHLLLLVAHHRRILA
jgi:hypothetical protein